MLDSGTVVPKYDTDCSMFPAGFYNQGNCGGNSIKLIGIPNDPFIQHCFEAFA